MAKISYNHLHIPVQTRLSNGTEPNILPLNLEQTKLRDSNTKDTKINLDFPKTQNKSKQTRWIKIGMTSSYGPNKKMVVTYL